MRRAAGLPSLAVALCLCACGGAETPETTTSERAAEDEPDPVVTIALRYADAEASSEPEPTPQTRIVLVDIDSVRGRRTTDLGNYPGACSPVDLGREVLLAARCFWLGVSADVAIRREGDALVATRTDLREGSAAEAGREVVRIDLLPRTQIEVLSAPPSRALAP